MNQKTVEIEFHGRKVFFYINKDNEDNNNALEEALAHGLSITEFVNRSIRFYDIHRREAPKDAIDKNSGKKKTLLNTPLEDLYSYLQNHTKDVSEEIVNRYRNGQITTQKFAEIIIAIRSINIQFTHTKEVQDAISSLEEKDNFFTKVEAMSRIKIDRTKTLISDYFETHDDINKGKEIEERIRANPNAPEHILLPQPMICMLTDEEEKMIESENQ